MPTRPKRIEAPKRSAKTFDPAREERSKFYALGRWRRLRSSVLAESPLCVDPFDLHGARDVPARVVDHIEPRLSRPDLAFERENLQALCDSCHSRKSLMERGVGERRAPGDFPRSSGAAPGG